MSSVGSILDDRLFEALNSAPDFSAPAFLNEGLYGDYDREYNLRWTYNYKDMNIIGQPNVFEHEDGRRCCFLQLAYDRWQPAGVQDTSHLAIIVLTHGVPVNRHEWFEAVRKLARFAVVYTVDLLGMGWSSKPLDFDWTDSWNYQAHLLLEFLAGAGLHHTGKHREELADASRTTFLGGNDWGGGAVQRAVLMAKQRGLDKVKGYILGSTVALNGYWVQQIGALRSLANMPFKQGDDPDMVSKLQKAHKKGTLSAASLKLELDQVHPIFRGHAEAFVGSLTTLLETMHHRTPNILNQYSLAPLQAPYVEVSAYHVVSKNPSNTVYNYHAIRVLAQQANLALGNGLLLPHHSTENTAGIRFSEWDRPVLVMWGAQDKMMPAGQVHRFENISEAVRQANPASNFWVMGHVFENAGHFAASDQPELTADSILRFVKSVAGTRSLQHAYFGLTEIARQDEAWLEQHFEALLGIEPVITLLPSGATTPTPDIVTCENCSREAREEFDLNGITHDVCSEACQREIYKKCAKL